MEGKFSAIISSTKIASEEDGNSTPLGTNDERESSEAARPTEKAAWSGSNSASEVTLGVGGQGVRGKKDA